MSSRNSDFYQDKRSFRREIDKSDSYQNTLKMSLAAISNQSKEESDDKKPTESRIEFVKTVLDGNKLKPFVDFDNLNTETSRSTKMNKKIMDAKELFVSMNVELKYLKSGTTGHTFKAISKDDRNRAFAVKVCAYPKDEYGGINNLGRPENAELRMLKLLSYFVVNKCTPHFVLPIGTFNTSISNFIKVPRRIINLDEQKNEMYRKFVNRYQRGELEDFVSVLISEWCNGGDLLDYIRKNYQNMTLKEWKIILFQILFTLAKVQQIYPSFRHNDLKANNILVQLTEINSSNRKVYGYNIDKYKYYIPNINLQIKIWDFDFACIDGIIENNKVNSEWANSINISKVKNRYYDMHYFFNTLIRLFPQFYNGGVPREIVEFIHRIVPEKYRDNPDYVHKKGRIKINIEYTTPYDVITMDKLFEKYRYLEN